MSESLQIEIDAERLLRFFQQLPEAAFMSAWRRALRKTGNWVKSRVAKEVSKATKIPQKVLRSRMGFYLRDAQRGKIWLGLNEVGAHRLGVPRQTRKGVSVRGQRFDSAFLIPGKVGVFRRQGRERAPLERVNVDWSAAGEAAFNRVVKEVEARLLEVLEQEINYEIHKAVGRA